jgi:energy-coupling factor transporter ATP-binding protein EcfA2
MTDPSSSPRPDSSTQAIVSALLDPTNQERRTIRRYRIRQLASYVGLSGSGFGMVTTVTLLMNGQGLEAAIAFLLTVALTALVMMGTFARKLTDRILDKIEARLDEKIEPLANWMVDRLEQVVVSLWWRLTSPFEKRYIQHLIYAYRDFRTQGTRTLGPFTLNLEQVFVPLRVAPESLERIPSDMIRLSETHDSLQIWDFLAVVKQQPAFQRLVIIGAPGAGKSTLIEHLAITYAKRAQRRYHAKAPKLLPILLYLRDVREAIAEAPQISLVDLILQQPNIRSLNPPPQWFQQQLQRRCLVMLDGLDEVANPDHRRLVSAWVDHQIQLYPKAVFILTSRPHGYRSAPLSRAGTLLEVQPFNMAQMKQFIQNWYLQNERMRRAGNDDPGVRAIARHQALELINRIQKNAPLAAMATNPLLLTMIATVHCFRGALPGQRVELYAEICDVLLGRRHYAKGIDGSLTASQKKSVLQVLALNRMRHRTEEFTAVTGGVVIQKQLSAVAGDTLYPEEFLTHIETGSGLLVEDRAGTYKFAHRSFLEYLAAVQIKEQGQEMMLTRFIDDTWWEETIRLYAAQQDASNLIWAALQKQTVQSLSLAYDCMREALSVSDRSVRTELELLLDKGLESDDPNLFRLAVEVRLSRRLKELVRLDDAIEIDRTLITAAEYQLFIDEMQQSGSRHHPDHWSSDRFLPGTAHEPIRGLRSADAQEFCEWLTYRFSNLGDLYLEGDEQIFVGNVRFRLPQMTEAIDSPIADCYWCATGDGVQLINWPDTEQERILDQLRQAAHADQEPILNLTRSLKIPPLPLPPSRHAVPSIDRQQSLEQCRDRAFQRLLQQEVDLSADLERALSIQTVPLFQCGDYRDWRYEIDSIRDRHLALSSSLAYAKNHALILTSDRTLDAPHDLAFLRAYTPLVAMLWYDLAVLCDRMMSHRRLLRLNQLSRQQCQQLQQTFTQNRDAAFNLYAFWVLLDERSHHRLPVWEGLRIVRHGIEP